MDTRIPVTIITGFLGAGKTTLLNNIIKKHPQKKFAIIENEFGKIGIDGALIVGANEQIFELSNGCICCSLNNDFYDTINKLLDGDYVFNHLLIETTGIADPDSIIGSFISSEDIQLQFRIDSVVCLADAVNLEDLIDEQPEVRLQLSLADTILLNKVDSVSSAYAEALKELLGQVNPMASVHLVSQADISFFDILDTNAYSGKAIEQTTLAFRNLTLSSNTGIDQNSLLINKKPFQLKHDIMSEGFVIPGDFDLESFNVWMQNYLYFNSKTVLRVKGIASFKGLPHKYILQAVRGSFMVDRGDEWGDSNRFNKLIFIGKNIDRNLLEDNLYKLLSTDN